MNKLILCCLLAVSISSHAQKYGSAIGVRIGNEVYGLSFRQRIISQLSAEAMMTFQSDAFQFTVLPKYHVNVIGEGTNLYFGAGAHAGQLKDFGGFYGFDAMAGIELKFPALPITVSADVKPTYHINHEDWFEFPAAVTLSLVLAKETKEKRQKARKKRKKRKERKERRKERREARKEWLNAHVFKDKSS